MFKILLDKLKIIEKSDVGIYFDTLHDFEVHFYVVTCNCRSYFRFYYESRFHAGRKSFQAAIFHKKTQNAVP